MMLHIAAKYAEQRNISLSPKLLRKFADAPGPSLIIPRLYLGDFADAGNLKLLENLKITHVVSVIERQPWPLHKTRLNKLHINIHDEATSDILTHLDHTTQYITEALRNPESIVMVHCFKGKSRSATIVAAYLLAAGHSPPNVVETLDFLREKRSIIEPNIGFIHQLRQYHKIVQERKYPGSIVNDVKLEEEANSIEVVFTVDVEEASAAYSESSDSRDNIEKHSRKTQRRQRYERSVR